MKNPKSFEWDKGNSGKNWQKHKVSDQECEEVFFDWKFKVFYDAGHSKIEDRYYGLGTTWSNRRLFVVFTVRNEKIRVISARPMDRQERSEYEKDTQV